MDYLTSCQISLQGKVNQFTDSRMILLNLFPHRHTNIHFLIILFKGCIRISLKS